MLLSEPGAWAEPSLEPSLKRFADGRAEQQLGHHFSGALTEANLVARVGPMACTLKMIARLMPAPTRQYSIEVVPDWSDRNLAIRWLTRPSCLKVADLRADTTRKSGPIGYKEVDQ